MKASITLHNAQQGYQAFTGLWHEMKPLLIAGKRLHVIFKTDTRSIAQNNLMFSCLTDLSEQVEWFGRRFSPLRWKDFITAHIEGQDVVPNMDGDGFVILGKGKSTSEMTIGEMGEVIERCHAFGALEGVKWSRTSLGRDVPDECFAEAA